MQDAEQRNNKLLSSSDRKIGQASNQANGSTDSVVEADNADEEFMRYTYLLFPWEGRKKKGR